MMEKRIFIRPAFDKRHPDPSKNYGVHGCEMLFILKGEKGAIQFVIFTNWMLPSVQEEFDKKPVDAQFPYLFHKPYPADVGYHSYTPQYEGQESITEKCDILDGKPCYYDGSGLSAKKVFDILLREGSDGVWKYLEKHYHEIFDSVEENKQ